jgi:hypothetical protein
MGLDGDPRQVPDEVAQVEEAAQVDLASPQPALRIRTVLSMSTLP